MELLIENQLTVIAIFWIVIFIAFFKWKYSYWSRMGLKEKLPTTIPFGNMTEVFIGKTNIFEKIREIYFCLKNKGYLHGGIYFLTAPVYLPIKLDIIKNILQNDFKNFINHGMYVNEDVDPLTSHLFNLENEKWKNLRNKITPTLTPGKIKMMFQIMADCTKVLNKVLDDYSFKKEAIDIKDVFSRFTTDIISSAAFGLECNSLQYPNATFRTVGKTVFQTDWRGLLKIMAPMAFSVNFLKSLKMKQTAIETENFFMKLVKETMNYREKNNIIRNDFMNMLLQLKNRGYVSDDGKIFNNYGIQENNMTFNELVALSYGFFLGGYETSSTTSSFALYELAKNIEIQQKARKEINTVLEKHDGIITYEAMLEMSYLEQVIKESLRMYPPVPILMRQCNEDYEVPGTDVVIEKGVKVIIPISGVHLDPEYFPNPTKFDPDRFHEEHEQKIAPFAWLPFGEGPRMCIGAKFGLIQSKVGLTAILKNYKLTLNEKTIDPILYDKTSIVTSIIGGIWLNIEKI